MHNSVSRFTRRVIRYSFGVLIQARSMLQLFHNAHVEKHMLGEMYHVNTFLVDFDILLGPHMASLWHNAVRICSVQQ